MSNTPVGEPDHYRWNTAAGIACVINRTKALGILCGYIRIPKGHHLYKKDSDERGYGNEDYDIHGGITYADNTVPEEPAVPGEWWLGFDCGHAGDGIPSMPDSMDPRILGGVYRDFNYVKAQCEAFAAFIMGEETIHEWEVRS